MGFKSKYNLDIEDDVHTKKLSWYFAPAFIAFWFLLYLSLITTQTNRLPKALTKNDEALQPTAFIAQKAEETLIELTRIGPRVVGSTENEIITVAFLKQQIEKIQAEASSYFIFDIDVQQASGAYMHWSMINMYQGIQNVIVKLYSNESIDNENYLLLNSHYDSVPFSPGASDDGAMVATMLEVMRVIAKNQVPLKHPIIFLFNGAEENPLQGSHAFITQHKWAKNCKALINLDSAGSGGREILFQSGPNHPWLMNYYRRVPHPFANTLAEEVFQAGFIPSDTDFRIFRDFGNIPGLDMAYIFNGYVYHTRFDRVNVLSRASLQHTGDNVLELTKALANAPEIDDIDSYAEGHNIFYDFLGWFIIFYQFKTGIIINIFISLSAFLAIIASFYFMSECTGVTMASVLRRFTITVTIELASIAFAVSFAFFVAVFMDGINKSMSWYTSNWLIIGLYIFPVLFGMGILPAIYLERTKQDTLSLGFRIQLFLHSHCFCLAILLLACTICGIRSAYLLMLCIFFDVLALVINLICKWHRKSYWFAITVMICQIVPFIYNTYVVHVAILTMVPMLGRIGSAVNPDLAIAFMTVLFTLMFSGFIMPLFMFFRKTRIIICCFLAATIISIIIAATPAGFPYTPKYAAQRYALIHTHRRLHNADGTLRIDEAGVYIYPQDRHLSMAEECIKKIGIKHKVSDYCNDEMFCGLPLFNHRWHAAREQSYWVQVNEYPLIPTEYPKLTLVESVELDQITHRRFNFTLSGPDHMTIFIDLKNDAKILDWSFNKTLLNNKSEPPYFIYFTFGLDSSDLQFSIDVEKTTTTFDVPTFEIGIGGHWIHQNNTHNQILGIPIEHFPDYTYIQNWVGTYESWYF